MLIQFNVTNFKSFRNEVSLMMTAAKMTEFNERVITVSEERVLPVAAIFGANASGKSNVYCAMDVMSYFVTESFGFGGDKKKYDKVKPNPFLFDTETEKSDVTFEVFYTQPFDVKERIYNYGFSLGVNGVTEEWLNYKAKTGRKYSRIFYRSETELDLSGLPAKSQENIKVSLEPQVLVVSLGAKLKIAKCKAVFDWFDKNEFADFGNPISSFFRSYSLPENFVTDEKVREDVVRFFSSFDNQIKGFKVTEIPSEDGKAEPFYNVDALHRKKGSEQMASIPLADESVGTLKMFSLYADIKKVLYNGGVFFVDELNARLHPLLVRNLVLTFLNPELNKNHAQLVFTTNDVWQLSNQLLRRDEIWFTEKDGDGSSALYSLADFIDDNGERIRKDENYEKNYLLGKYGAIPTLEAISFR